MYLKEVAKIENQSVRLLYVVLVAIMSSTVNLDEVTHAVYLSPTLFMFSVAFARGHTTRNQSDE